MPKETFFNIEKSKQKRVLDAAKSVFIKYHYEDVTIDKIVAKAAIAKGSFYQYFDNKEELFTYLFFRLGQHKESYLKQFIKSSDIDDFVEFLMILDDTGYAYETATKERRIFRQKLLQECPQEVMRKIVAKLLPETYNLFDYAIAKYQDLGVIKRGIDTKQAGYIIASCFYNQAFFPATSNHREDLKETIQHAIGYIFEAPST